MRVIVQPPGRSPAARSLRAGVLTRSRPDANDAVVIELVGEIDVGVVNALERRLATARDAGHRRVVVDLSAVTVVFGTQTTSQLCDALGRRNKSVSVTVIGGPVPVRRLLDSEPINPPDQHAVRSVMAASSERSRSAVFNA